MTKDDIISMGEAADKYADNKLGWGEFHPDWHDVRDEWFANLVSAKVRKECAELCRAEANGRSPLAFDALHECADLMMKGYEE